MRSATSILLSTFAKAALDAGVRRIIYLGGLGETGPGLSEHLSSRRDVESALGSAGVPVTVLRAAMIIGSGSASFEILRYLVQRLPVMITPKWVTTRCQPIAVENVLTYLVGVLSAPETIGGVFDIGGSETLCYRDIMRIMAEELGLPRRRIIAVPVLTPRLSSYWIHLVTPLSNKIARPLAEGLKNEVVCREDRITRIIPQKLLNVREAIHAALSQVESHLVETNWTMAGPMPGDPDWSGGTVFRDEREVGIAAPAGAVFRAVCRLGGRTWVVCGLALEDSRRTGSTGRRTRPAPRPAGSRHAQVRRRSRFLASGRFGPGSLPFLAGRNASARPGAARFQDWSEWCAELHAATDRPL